jgi:hypothetical protein
MAGLSDRDPAKCRRDALQADVVQAMLASKLVASALDRP